MQPYCFIYGLLDQNDKIRYIGKSINPEKRYYYHLKDKEDTYKTRWINSLKTKGLVPKLKKLVIVSEKDWEFYEKRFISSLPNLTNTTVGGETGPSRKNSKMSPSTREKLKDVFFKKGHIPFNKGLIGRPTETIEKCAKKRSRGPYTVISPNGEIFNIDNLKKFAREYNLNSSNLYNVVNKNKNRTQYNGWRIERGNSL